MLLYLTAKKITPLKDSLISKQPKMNAKDLLMRDKKLERSKEKKTGRPNLVKLLKK